ncbi:MAG: hypothetical protein ABIR57_11850 [Aeromicrobium sp.]
MNSSRRRGAVRLAILGIVAASMTACGTVHPGSAAIVDGQTISMKTADKASAAYCRLALVVAAQQGAKEVSAADTRRQSVTDLVMFEVAKKVAKRHHLVIDPATYLLTEKQRAQVAQAFPHGDLKQIRDAIERSQQTYAITIALGEESTGEKVTATTQSALESVGQSVITKSYKSSDISIDPRFGLDSTTKQIAQTGSLSVPEGEEPTDLSALPASQRCS